MPTTTSRSVWADAPPDTVAAFLCDFTTSARWDPYTVSSRRLDLGSLTVGAVFENVQRIAGRTVTLTYRVTHYHTGRRIVFEGGNDTIRARDDIVFHHDPLSGRTIVTYTADVTLLGRAKTGQPLMRAVMKKSPTTAPPGSAYTCNNYDRPILGLSCPPVAAARSEVTAPRSCAYS